MPISCEVNKILHGQFLSFWFAEGKSLQLQVFAISTIPTLAWVGLSVLKVGLVSVGCGRGGGGVLAEGTKYFHFSNRSGLMLTL